MSLKVAIQSLGGDLNITNLDVDKDADLRGRPATKVVFEYDTAEGRKRFEGVITNDLKVEDSAKAALIVDAARKRAKSQLFVWEEEK